MFPDSSFLRGPRARSCRLLILLGCSLTCLAPAATAPDQPANLIECRRIWDAAPHNAFTDLVRFRGRWFCVFREGKDHVSPDGAIRVLSSKDGKSWTSVARLTSPSADLRDPKVTLAPDRRLMLSAAGALHPPAANKHQSYVWFSRDGHDWTPPLAVGDPNLWLWRITWHRRAAYGIGYDTTAEHFIRLYTSRDGRKFDVLLPRLFDVGHPNETSILFQPDHTALCLLRRDGDPGSGQLGIARPPYRDWAWRDLGIRIGGPHLLRVPDGRLVAAARLYDGTVRTSLLWLDPAQARLTEFMRLPSGGDCSYPGLVWHRGELWVSYYSSHEGKAAIYLAQVRLPPAER